MGCLDKYAMASVIVRSCTVSVGIVEDVMEGKAGKTREWWRNNLVDLLLLPTDIQSSGMTTLEVPM